MNTLYEMHTLRQNGKISTVCPKVSARKVMMDFDKIWYFGGGKGLQYSRGLPAGCQAQFFSLRHSRKLHYKCQLVECRKIPENHSLNITYT